MQDMLATSTSSLSDSDIRQTLTSKFVVRHGEGKHAGVQAQSKCTRPSVLLDWAPVEKTPGWNRTTITIRND